MYDIKIKLKNKKLINVVIVKPPLKKLMQELEELTGLKYNRTEDSLFQTVEMILDFCSKTDGKEIDMKKFIKATLMIVGVYFQEEENGYLCLTDYGKCIVYVPNLKCNYIIHLDRLISNIAIGNFNWSESYEQVDEIIDNPSELPNVFFTGELITKA